MPSQSWRLRCPQALLAIVGLLVAFPLRCDEVNLSRYKLTVTALFNETQYLPVDESVLVAFCRDGDGCTINLEQIRGDSWEVGQAKLYRGPDPSFLNVWRVLGGPTHLDGNNTADIALELIDALGSCVLWDGEWIVGTVDGLQGFALVEFNNTGISLGICTLTVID